MLNKNHYRISYAILLLGLAASRAAVGASGLPGENLALGASVKVSSAVGSWASGDSAVDGELSTKWKADADGREFIKVDFGEVHILSRVVVQWLRPNNVSYVVKVSADGSSWNKVDSGKLGSDEQLVVDIPNKPVRYLRINGTDADGSELVSIREIEAYGTGGSVGTALTIQWRAPTKNEDGSTLVDLAGYTLYALRDGDIMPYAVQVPQPGLTAYTFQGLTPGLWHLYAQSYNKSGVSSELSRSVSYLID